MPIELALQNLGSTWSAMDLPKIRIQARTLVAFSRCWQVAFLLHVGAPMLSLLEARTRLAALSLDETSGNQSLSVPQEHRAAWSGDVRFLSNTL